MGVRFYDEAITAKIQKWIPETENPNDKIKVLKPDETSRLFQLRNDQKKDAPLKLPLICLSRDNEISLNLRTKNVLSFDGVKVGQSEEKTLHMDCIPIDLTYHLDIYTRRYDEGDEYVRNFVFQIANHPRFYIEIPYNGYFIKHVAYMRLGTTIVDNSSVPEKLFADEFTRWTIDIEIADAYLFSTPYSKNWKLELDTSQIEIQDGNLTSEELAAIRKVEKEQHLTPQQVGELKKQYLEKHVIVEKIPDDKTEAS